MSTAELLLDLQDTDLAIDRLAKRLGEVKAAQRETDELIAARQAAQDAEQQVVHHRSVRKEIELANTALEEKIQQAEDRLYSGRVKNPKELLDLQNDIGSLKRQKTALDDQLFDAMVALEESETRLNQHAADRLHIETDWRAGQSDLFNEQTQLEVELKKHTQDQVATRARLNATDLALYDQLRRRKGGLAIVEVSGNMCGGCGVRLTASVVQQLNQASQLARCGNCERMLVRL